jgi:hypothetical protein
MEHVLGNNFITVLDSVEIRRYWQGGGQMYAPSFQMLVCLDTILSNPDCRGYLSVHATLTNNNPSLPADWSL